MQDNNPIPRNYINIKVWCNKRTIHTQRATLSGTLDQTLKACVAKSLSLNEDNIESVMITGYHYKDIKMCELQQRGITFQGDSGTIFVMVDNIAAKTLCEIQEKPFVEADNTQEKLQNYLKTLTKHDNQELRQQATTALGTIDKGVNQENKSILKEILDMIIALLNSLSEKQPKITQELIQNYRDTL